MTDEDTKPTAERSLSNDDTVKADVSEIESQSSPIFSDDEQDDDERTTLDDDFDWDDADPEEINCKEKQRHDRRCCLCLSRSSSKKAWMLFIAVALVAVAVCATVFLTVKPQTDPTMASYNLALWFTFIAFMFCINFIMQIFIEIVPWIIKKAVAFVAPHQIELTRARLSYYMVLRPHSKLLAVGAWAWGSWAYLRHTLPLPEGTIRPNYVKTFESIWESFFLLTLLLFIEKFILQLIVTSFHKKAYGERINSNARALKILDKLKKVKRAENPQEFLLKKIKKKVCDTVHPNTSGTSSPVKGILHSDTVYKENVRFPTKRLDTLIAIPPLHDRTQSQQTSEDFRRKQSTTVEEKAEQLDEAEEERIERNLQDFENRDKVKRPQFSRSNTSISSFTTDSASATAFSTKHYGLFTKLKDQSQFQDPVKQAKHLAKRIFYNIMGKNPVRQYVIEADFYPYFKTLTDAKEAFSLFDTDGNGDISKHELRAGCIRIYRDRKDLNRSMRDMSQATGKLDIILMAVFLCLWVIVVLAVFGINVGTELMPLWSAFIAASFIFGNSAKDAFESIIFVFVTHPFDTGDRIMIADNNWIVNNVGLLVSTFLNWDGSVIYAKNSVLATQYIVNCRRTGRTSESFNIQISYYTPSWKITALRDHMVTWNNKYPKLFTKDACGCNITALENLNMITLAFYFEHTKNWQDSGGRWLRHNNFMLELKDELQRLNITYTKPDQPVIHRYENVTGESIEDHSSSEVRDLGPDGKPYKRRPWRRDEDCAVQNQSAGSGGQGPGASSSANSTDAGFAAGAAATVAFTTGVL